jgi:3-keto-disaccharide hydrolase
MRHSFVILLLISCVTLPLSAQSPEGWKMRVDRSQSAQDPDDRPDLTFVSKGKGLHVKGGPAGTFWDARNNAAGNYTLKATFNLNQPSSHTNYYGLIFGGSQLDGATQTYTYFVVAQDGSYLIRHRAGNDVRDVMPAPNQAVKQPDGSGRSSNTLEVRVAGDKVSYVVNGAVVHTVAKNSVTTDGIVGFRVNHQLDVAVEGFDLRRS